MYFRARYYDPEMGEFISRDPLEYVDGMSLYRGYFVPGGVDPFGLYLEPPPGGFGPSPPPVGPMRPGGALPPQDVAIYPKPSTNPNGTFGGGFGPGLDGAEKCFSIDGVRTCKNNGIIPIEMGGLNDLSNGLNGMPVGNLMILCHGNGKGEMAINGAFSGKPFIGVGSDDQKKNLEQMLEGVNFSSPCVIELRGCFTGANPELSETIAELTGCTVKGNSGKCGDSGDSRGPGITNSPLDVVTLPVGP